MTLRRTFGGLSVAAASVMSMIVLGGCSNSPSTDNPAASDQPDTPSIQGGTGKHGPMFPSAAGSRTRLSRSRRG